MSDRRRIILLCAHELAPDLAGFVIAQNPQSDVSRADTNDQLREMITDARGEVRIISFLSDLIVPAAILRLLKLTPYNIHGGPPEFPGSHANSFAILAGATSYGVTAHEMTARVDEGAIVAVRRFCISEQVDRLTLADAAFAKAVELFAVVAGFCATRDGDLPPIPERWSPHKTTKKDFRALCAETPADPVRRDRLTRACGADWVGDKVAHLAH